MSERTISVGDVVHGLTVVRVTRDERPGGAFGPGFVVLGWRDTEHGEFWAVEWVNARTGNLESGGLSGTDRTHVEPVYEYRAGLASPAKSPRTGVVPSSWMGITGQLGATAHLQLLAAVDEAGVEHGDLDAVRRIWQQLT